MRAEGYEFSIFPGDVSDTASSQALVAAIEAELGPIEILINNAGITRDTTFHRMTPEQWHEVVNTNLNACFNVTRPVIEGMRARKWGRIVQISSINGLKGQYGQANYARPKPACTASRFPGTRERQARHHRQRSRPAMWAPTW